MKSPARSTERTQALVCSRAAVEPDSVSEESRSVEVIASTDAIDGHGTILRQNWRLDRYNANPVVLYAHDACELPIGLATNVRVDGGALKATLTFSTEDLNPQAEQIWKNIKAKVVRGVSVGFWPHSVTYERQNDRDIVVLDDNELLEISMVPVGSNPETLAQMRALAMAPAPQEPPAPSAAEVNTASANPQETQIMSEPTNPTILRALGLPVGATESDGIACATRLREFEVGTVALLSLQSTAEALGAVRGLKAKADGYDAMATELATIKGERDQQNFDVQLQRGVNERKLSPETARLYREEFNASLAEGRGAQVVSRLKGFVDVAPTLVQARATQPKTPVGSGGGDIPIEWNGVAYRDLKPAKRAELARAEPDLYRAMKSEWESAGRPQPTKASA
jgi:HK97 family phage prohead protease